MAKVLAAQNVVYEMKINKLFTKKIPFSVRVFYLPFERKFITFI